MTGGKRALDFPKWVEAALIVLLAVMAVVEEVHGEWVWAVIFGVSAALFGASLIARVIRGEKDGGK